MLFIDTANIEEIKKYKKLGVISGITTNQKIFLKEKHGNFRETIQELGKVSGNLPLNLELTNTSGTDKELESEAVNYFESAKKIVIKIPMWGDGRGLRVANRLKKIGIPVNVTCCMSVEQAILASLIDADYVSLFFNRIVDHYKTIDFKHPYEAACGVISAASNYLNEYGLSTQIIAGSIRKSMDVVAAFTHGADIVTVPPKILAEMIQHPKTEATIKEFDEAWKELNIK